MAFTSSGVSIESWVQLAPGVAMRHEIDLLNQQVMLCFGARDEYVLILSRDNLEQFMALGAKVMGEFDRAG